MKHTPRSILALMLAALAAIPGPLAAEGPGPTDAIWGVSGTRLPLDAKALESLNVLSDERAKSLIRSIGDLQTALTSYHVAPCKNLALTTGRGIVSSLRYPLQLLGMKAERAGRLVYDSVENAAKDTAAQNEIERRMEQITKAVSSAKENAGQKIETPTGPVGTAIQNIRLSFNSPCKLVDQILTDEQHALLIQQLAILTRVAQGYSSFQASLKAARGREFLEKHTADSGRLLANDQQLFLSSISALRADMAENLKKLEKFQVAFSRSAEKSDQLWQRQQASAQQVPQLKQRLDAAQAGRDRIQKRLDVHIVNTKLFISGVLSPGRN